MNEERIKEVFSDEAFLKELFSKETPEEVQVLLAEKDIALSIDEIVKLREILEKKLQQAQSGEEISDDDLEEVAGGVYDLIALGVVLFVGIVATYIALDNRGRW